MKNIYEVKQWVLEVLLEANIPINGAIYKDKRFDVTKEDIVINSLPMTADFLQVANINVNCYVPNQKVKVYGGLEIFIPNEKRLAEIAQKVNEALKYKFDKRFNLAIEYHQQIEEKTENAHYINFRLRVNAFN